MFVNVETIWNNLTIHSFIELLLTLFSIEQLIMGLFSYLKKF